MYAVIQTGGKQYKVAVGDKLRVEKLAADEGAQVALERVLLIADGVRLTTGADATDAAVQATVVGHGRGDKIRVFKMKRRKDYRRTMGHRQRYTELVITAIDGGAGDVADAATPTTVTMATAADSVAADSTVTDSTVTAAADSAGADSTVTTAGDFMPAATEEQTHGA